MSSRLLGSLTAGKKKPSSGPSWLEKHWDTTVVLLGIFIIAMMVRAYFAYETATEFGLPYLLGGGADSHYNARIINYIAEYNEHLFTDPLRAYPLEGKVNTRPPLYQWSIVLGGYLLLPFVGNLDKAINHSFILSSAFWGALTVFPIYLIGKRTFGKKAGIAGAFLLAISAAHLERGVLTNTNHDAFSMFLIVTTFFFFMRSLEEITAGRKWVSDWMKLDEIKKGLSRYLGSNKKSMLYAAMTGITTGAIALTWKGYSYAVVIILVYFLIQLFIDKFREKDSLGITVNIFIIFMIAFLIALPWYAMYSPKILTDWFSWPLNRWFQVPFIIFLGTFGIGVYFTVTRDLPWLLTFSIIIAAGVIFFTLGPDVIQTAAGQYFIENKMYATIAEAQPPMFSRLVLAGGLATFFLSWVGIALAAWHLRIEWTRSFVFILIWTAFAIYMTTTAVRFIFNAAPAFALTAGWVLALVFDKTGFDEIGRYFRRRRGSVLIRIKEGVKIKHVLVTLLIVFLLLTPNALYAIDAGIPYEEKQRYEEQIYDTLPSFLRPPDYNPEDGGYHYLGAFGYTMDKPTEYWPTAWEDLRQQNKDIPPEERPAFLSWWDYGFEAMNQGEHPTVADNFQHAHRFAGNFLMAQNESEMMALLVGRQLQLPYSEEGGFEGRVEEILIEHIGEEKTEELEDIYRNPASYRNEVLSNPDRYHPRADDIDNVNIRWAMVMGTLSYENLDTLSSLYRSISFDSGYERLENRIGYFAVDSRMFPTSARDTGIFHAPAFLSGHRVDESGRGRVPIDFYKMVFVDQQGRTYESQEEIPQDAQIVDQRIEFQPMFYNSALYRIFAGYNLEEIGEEKGIPGIDNQDSQRSRPRDQPKEPKPGWNFTHFNEFHRTAYFNPYPRDEVQNHTDAWRAMPYREAIEYARDENVTVDLSGRSYMGQGVIFLRYFDGAILEGQVRTEDGEPIPNAKVTVLDTNTSGRYPTPQHTSRTDEDGRYRAILPEGNITVMVSTGGDGEEVIKQEQIVLGSEQFEINEEQAMRRRTDKDGDGRWDYQLEKDFEVQSGQISGKVFLDREGTGEYDEQNDTVVSSVGEVRMKNEFSEVNYALDIEDGNYEFDRAIPGIYTVNTTIPGSESSEGVEVNPGEKTNRDIPVSTGNITGSVNFEEEGLEGETVTLSLRSMDRTKDVVLGEMRNFKFENIPPGEYTLEIENEDYTLSQGPQVIEMVEGESIERFVTVVSAHRVEGVIKEGGARIPNQRLNIFTKEYDRDIITDDEGEFSIKLPRGHYNIYGVNRQGTEVSAYLDDVLVEGDIANYEGVFEDAHKLSGTAEYKEQGADKAEIFVIDGSGSEYHMTTNQEGRFRAYLPEGQYTVYGWKQFDPETDLEYSLYFWREGYLNFDKDRDVTLEASSASILRGKVVRDTLPEEGIFAELKVESEDRTLKASTTIDGEYQLYLPEGECTFTIEKYGYHEWTETIDPSEEDLGDGGQIPLNARNVTIEGNLNLGDHAIDKMTVEFIPDGHGAVKKEKTFYENNYTVELQPGSYRIYGDHFGDGDEATKYNISDSLIIRPEDEHIEKDLEIEYKVRLRGKITPHEDETPSADIYFQGPENKMISANESYEIYLKEGDYSVRAIHPRGISAVQRNLTLEGHNEIDLILGGTTRIDSNIGGPPGDEIDVRFKNVESGYVIDTSTDVDGTLDLNISHGEYEVTVNHRTEEEIDGKTRDVLYHLDRTVEVPPVPSLNLDKRILNSTLSGTIRVGEEPVKGGEIEQLKIRSKNEVYSPEVDDQGAFEIEELVHGNYTIYISAWAGNSDYAYFETFDMPAEDNHLEISLEKSVIFSGDVYIDGDSVETELDLRRGKAHNTFQTEKDGSFDIFLPRDRYHLYIEATKDTEFGLTSYTRSQEIDIKDYTYRDIELSKVKEYSVDINGMESKTASRGEVVEYTAQITNTGNAPDEYEFSIKGADWDVSIYPEKTDTIGPDKSKYIEIEVEVGEDANVGDSVTLVASSPNLDEVEEKEIPLQVKQLFGVRISEEIKDRKFRSRELNYSVEIENMGNGPDTFQIEILNREELKDYGWDVTVANQTNEIEAQETESIQVSLNSISPSPRENVEIKLRVTSEGDGSVYEERTISASIPKLTAYEEDIKFETESFKLEEEPIITLSNWQWGGIIILVSLGALYILRKKRWI